MRALAAAVALVCGACSFAPPKPDLEPPLPPAKPAAKTKQTLRIAGEEVLSQRPSIAALGPFDAPVPALLTLSNGLKLYVVHRPAAGLEAVGFFTRRGSTSDPAGKEGLASLSAAMLQSGSAGKSQAEVAAAADALGANLGVEASADELGIELSALAPRLPQLAALLADVALRPNLDAKDWKKVQAQRLAELTAEKSEPVSAAQAAFLAALYGKGPLGHPPEGTLPAVKRLSLGDVKTFLASVSPDDSALVAVGSVPPDQVRAVLEGAFGAWKASRRAAVQPRPMVLPSSRPRFVLVDFPSKPQSVLVVGQPGVPRSSPDRLALTLANAVLGGGASITSRLNQNLREKHGYSYGAGSSFAFGRGPGPFAASTSVQVDVTAKSVVEVFNELNRLVAEPLPAEDLSKGKALLAFGLVERLQSVDATVQAVGALFIYDLPLDEYRTFVPRLQALTAAAVHRAVQRALQPGSMTLVIAGDEKVVLPQLQADAALKLPPPQRRNAEGQLLGRPAPAVSGGGASGTSQTKAHP
jgi:zinc protease